MLQHGLLSHVFPVLGRRPGDGTLSGEATDHVLWQAARLGAGTNATYIDRLDGIGGDFFDSFAGEWRGEQEHL